MDSLEEAGKLPVQECPPSASGMGSLPERLRLSIIITPESEGLILEDVQFGDIERATLLVSVLPDEEDLIDRPESVDLKLRIGITAVDENLGIVFLKNQRAFFSEVGLNIGFFKPETHVKVFVIPQCSSSRVVEAGLSRNHVHETWRFLGHLPRGLVQQPVNL